MNAKHFKIDEWIIWMGGRFPKNGLSFPGPGGRIRRVLALSNVLSNYAGVYTVVPCCERQAGSAAYHFQPSP